VAYVFGFDPAGASGSRSGDFSALSIIESRVQLPDPARPRRALDWTLGHRVIHLERSRGETHAAALRTMRRRKAEIEAHDSRTGRRPQDFFLVVDATGIGGPIVEMILGGDLDFDEVRAVVITSGHQVVVHPGTVSVPKRDLVAAIGRTAEEGRLRIAGDLTLASVLAQELRNFRVKLTAAGGDAYESVRQKDHDDLVLATALSVWAGEALAAPRFSGSVAAGWN
jgi:hypothetical protein